MNWPKEKKKGDVYVAENGSKWIWNGKAWTAFKEKEIFQNQASGMGYLFSHSYIDPADDVSYYIGDVSEMPPQSSFPSPSKRVKMPVDGKISTVTIKTHILGDLGSDESQTFLLCNFTKGTSRCITSAYSHSSNNMLDSFQIEDRLEVSAGDEIYIEWKSPSFADSPRGVMHNFNIYLER